MVKTPKLPALSLVGPGATGPQPPRSLGPHGLRLWNAVHRAYAITDVGGIELLCLACQALDRAEALREAIDRDGQVFHTRTGLRANPLLRDELANRAFCARTLDRLGINAESVKPVGRPSRSFGVTQDFFHHGHDTNTD
jgi:hypothetical protein